MSEIANHRRIARLVASGDRRPHAMRARYVAGCRCMLCRAANSRYQTHRDALKRAGETNRLVSTARVLVHLDGLSAQSVGYKSVADAASVSYSVMRRIKLAHTTQLREQTERRILAVDVGARAGGAKVPAGPTLRLIAKLVHSGYTRFWIARQLGYRGQGLQFHSQGITARNAVRVERLYRRIEGGLVQR